jgi:type II secretory pathway component GspD/PulD (secretin)
VSESEDEQERSIPVLGDLPIIGGLFRSVDRTRPHTRLAFFVTTHIIRTDPDDSGGGVHG